MTLEKLQNGNNLVSIPEFELKLGLAVAVSHSQHILQILYISLDYCLKHKYGNN